MFSPASAVDSQEHVSITINGKETSVRAGLPLALALMEAGITPLRHSVVSGAPRSPLCLMGVCFECLVHVDDSRNVESCMIEVRQGMSVELANGPRPMESAP
ncbi:putative molibdopterin-dependent oxidoreductase YjgC [Neorhizobium huautlense]|uniref:Molibdopterin-dependent oxidoreductase YjgC n=1 Tax=Neorhizobium huautlense TaxID=67774 RepID=A0ABT9PZW0_9HYPH|nr:(2Fe-2S)-binding protein [Neorhizobium huautlense]MDP9839765.1 putative molibdopterin-dependent oxidoreductase YjgC [Neorhizobium huautlense]